MTNFFVTKNTFCCSDQSTHNFIVRFCKSKSIVHKAMLRTQCYCSRFSFFLTLLSKYHIIFVISLMVLLLMFISSWIVTCDLNCFGINSMPLQGQSLSLLICSSMLLQVHLYGHLANCNSMLLQGQSLSLVNRHICRQHILT